jgi:hypothetical protein
MDGSVKVNQIQVNYKQFKIKVMSRTAIIITSNLIVGVGVGTFFIGRAVGKKSSSSGDSDK